MEPNQSSEPSQAFDGLLSLLGGLDGSDILRLMQIALPPEKRQALERVIALLAAGDGLRSDSTAESGLSPAQQQARDGILYALPLSHVFWLWGGRGMGKTTVLRDVHRTTGGAFLTMRDFMDAIRDHHPLAVEETLDQLLRGALEQHDCVILDDLDILQQLNYRDYPRHGFLDAPLTALLAYAAEAGKKLIVGGEGVPEPVRVRSYPFGIPAFQSADYEALCAIFLGRARARRLDFGKVHRFAPNLNAYQLKGSCSWLQREDELDTERFIAYLESQHLTSNVDLEEVQAVDLHDLKGVDALVESLEASVILPLENDALAKELNLAPKRGVLLAGLPGTGKTTVGRALAHRLRSKFFLIDGTVISGGYDFYDKVQKIFEQAKRNAASIIFIDDSDVIFENGSDTGFYRYLLTMLDGLESESIGRICIMLTAMEVGTLPPALLRSGRIELWLETRLPDEPARAAILADHLAGAAAAIGEVDVAQLATASDGLTGADLKRVAEDGRLLFAYDKARDLPPRPPTDYFLDAVETVRRNKQRYAEAEARARALKAAQTS